MLAIKEHRFVAACFGVVLLAASLSVGAQTVVYDTFGRPIRLLDDHTGQVLMEQVYEGMSSVPLAYWIVDQQTLDGIPRWYFQAELNQDASISALVPRDRMMTDAELAAFNAAMARDFSTQEIALASSDITDHFTIQASSSKVVLTNSSATVIVLPITMVLSPGGAMSVGSAGSALQPGNSVAVTFPASSNGAPEVAVLSAPPEVPLPYAECEHFCDSRFQGWAMWGCALTAPITEVGAYACLIAAKAAYLICVSKCAPTPPNGVAEFLWCDENQRLPLLQSASSCGTDPAAVLAHFCTRESPLTVPGPLTYVTPYNINAWCLDPHHPDDQGIYAPLRMIGVCLNGIVTDAQWAFDHTGSPGGLCVGASR